MNAETTAAAVRTEDRKKTKKDSFAAGLRKEWNKIIWPNRKKLTLQTAAVLCVTAVMAGFIVLIDSGALALVQYAVSVKLAENKDLIRHILMMLYAAVSAALAVLILLQQGSDKGLGSLGGQMMSDTFWNKAKGRSQEGIRKKATVILICCFTGLSVLLGMVF